MSEDFSYLNDQETSKVSLNNVRQNIAVYAENDFTPNCDYKKANKNLLGDIKRLGDSDTYKMRMVKDVIPESNLARYGNYPYNESRERSYASPGTDVIVHSYRSKLNVEPWMWPEVEQIFLHTILTGSYNFKLYEAGMGGEKNELNSIQMQSLFGDECVMERLFDRTPGRPSRKKQEVPVKASKPHYMETDNCNAEFLKDIILSDTVKDLWGKQKLENQTKLLKVYKSALGNLFVEEGQTRYSTTLKSADSDRSLKKLTKSISILNESIRKIQEAEEDVVEETTPVKRLYSQVVQGNKFPIQETRPKVSTSEVRTSTTKIPLIPEYEEKFEENLKPIFPKSEFANPPTLPAQNLKFSVSDTQNVSSSYNVDNPQIVHETAPGFERGSASVQNFYNVMQCAQNNQNRMGYPYNPLYSGQIRPNIPNIPNIHLNVNYQQQQPQIPWYLPLRPSNLYNNHAYGSFSILPLLPPAPPTNKPRWNPPRAQPGQNWQHLYQQNNPNKPKNGCKLPQARPTKNFKKVVVPTQSNRATFVATNFTKPQQDYKLMMRQEAMSGPSTSRCFEGSEVLEGLQDLEATIASSRISEIPVTYSASEELEKIALREYHSSNDIFSEIERQAKEQYEENPENLYSCPPPTNHHVEESSETSAILYHSHVDNTDLY